MKSAKYLWPVLKQSNETALKSWRKHSTPKICTLRKYSSENAQSEEIVAQQKIHLTKPSVVKWKRPPFLKNFFFGKFDTELFAFPEILDKEQLSELEGSVLNLNDVMKQKVDSVQIDKTCHIPDDVLQELKEMGLFGRMIPANYGGLDLTYTACTRLNEVLGLDWSLFSTLAAHEFLATEAILKFGSPTQKAHYLPRLASGELIGAFCCYEKDSGSDLWSISTKAEQVTDGSYIINGTKAWVTNAGRAGVFIVFAKSENQVDPKMIEISAFIVDRNSEGIEIVKQNKTCLHGTETGLITFKNVIVPSSNIIKGIGEGFPVCYKSMESFRIALNSFTFGTLKALLDSITERIIHTERLGESLADRQLIRRRLSKISSMIYGMESVSYFTAALLDSTENPDVELESAALKLFNSRGTLYCLREMMELVGSSSLMEDMQLERFYRDAQGLAMFDAPNDIVKLYLSLTGIQNVGRSKVEEVIKLRNTFFFPKNTLKAYYRRWKISKGMHKYDQDLAGHIHPSLVASGNRLEEKLQTFELCVENIIASHGAKVVLTQIDPRTLADAAADLYAISAVLSRCSRSYCIGLKNCHHELTLALTFCQDADDRLLDNLNSILLGVNENNEARNLMIAEQVIDCQGYFPEHPLKHNF